MRKIAGGFGEAKDSHKCGKRNGKQQGAVCEYNACKRVLGFTELRKDQIAATYGRAKEEGNKSEGQMSVGRSVADGNAEFSQEKQRGGKDSKLKGGYEGTTSHKR